MDVKNQHKQFKHTTFVTNAREKMVNMDSGNHMNTCNCLPSYCLFDFLHPSQQFISYAWTGIPRFYQF